MSRHIPDTILGDRFTKIETILTKPGTLWLVVGPSGVGKDSLIDGARHKLGDDARFAFPRREITRPPDAGGEEHVAITEEEFRFRRLYGHYILSWEANGLCYGVPVLVKEDLAAGRIVVLNGSRRAVADARTKVLNLRVFEVTAPEHILRARLKARGRETEVEIERRLARASAIKTEGFDVVRFVNDGRLQESIDAFVAVLRGAQ